MLLSLSFLLQIFVLVFNDMPDRPDGLIEPLIGSTSSVRGIPRRSIRLGYIDYRERRVPISIERVRVGDQPPIWVFSAHNLTVKSSKNEIQSVRVFDLLGRALAHYPNANSMEVPLTTIQQTDSGLIIQVTLSNGTVVTKKTIY